MNDNTYLCHGCGSIFRMTAETGDVACPQCGSVETRTLPSWVPLGSDLANGPLEWEYECQHCRHKFKLPVPARPDDEKNIRCPACNAGHIHRLTTAGYEPLYCG